MELTETLEWEGRTIACGRAGAGPDVVFCHGTPFSSRVWSRYADALTDRFRVHLWDMPGYGRSSMESDHAIDFGWQARALAALLTHWRLDRPHVVAHDIGGSVAVRAGLEAGATYASLVLVDTVVIPPAGSPFFRFVQAHPTVLGELPAYVHEAILRAYVAGATHRGLAPDDLDALVEPWTGKVGQPAFYRQIAAFDEAYLVDTEARLEALDLPVHVVWGADDAWVPLDTGRRLAALIPGARLTEVAGAGHLVQYDAPVELASLLGAWLTEQSG